MPSFDSDWMMGLKGIFLLASSHFSLPFKFSIMMMYYFYNQKNEIKYNIAKQIWFDYTLSSSLWLSKDV